MIEDYNASGQIEDVNHEYETPNPRRAKAIEDDGDFLMNLNYDGKTVATVMDSDSYGEQSDWLLNGKTPWITGEDVDEFGITTEPGTQYALVNEGGSLMLYDEDGKVERVGEGQETDGVVAHFWEEDTGNHFEERESLTVVPGQNTEISTRETLI